MHDRNYFGEFDAAVLIEWLNSKARPQGDPVETLLNMNAGLPAVSTAQDIESYLARLVRRSKLAVAPVLKAIPNKWEINWRMVGHMDPLQGLALIRLLHLAEKGALGRVRKCTCGRWFYARFEHQRFHAAKCQQEAFRRDPDWKRYRARYMRELRHEKKSREQKWLRASKRKDRR
jgi:hypothetical protein